MDNRHSLIPARVALRRRSFRVAAVHYWQGHWNYNFWSNVDPDAVHDDFERMAALGFNTVVLVVSWGVFQPQAFPAVYDDDAYARLDAIVAAAASHGLYVVLRLGTSEWLPAGIDGCNFHVPYLLFDDRETAAFVDLYGETARRMRAHDNVLFLFCAWEDMYGHVHLARQSEADRFAYKARTWRFFGHLATQPIEHWNRRWGASYRALEDVPYPAVGTPEYTDLLTWINYRIRDVLLPRVALAARNADPAVGLGFEVRVDGDLVTDRDGKQSWFEHEYTWCLPAAFDVVCAYFNPAIGALNDGSTVPASSVSRSLRRIVKRLRRRARGRRLFIDQLNFVDTTPAFAHNARLANEDEIASFLEDGVDYLLHKTIGYAIWSLSAYEGNVLCNSQFRLGLWQWQIEGCGTAADGCLSLRSGAKATQRVLANFNPGHATPDVPYTVRLRGAGGPLLVRLVPRSGRIPMQEQTIEFGDATTVRQWQWPMVLHFDLELHALDGETRIESIAVSNHLQESALFDPFGKALGRRAEVIRGVNQRRLGSVK